MTKDKIKARLLTEIKRPESFLLNWEGVLNDMVELLVSTDLADRYESSDDPRMYEAVHIKLVAIVNALWEDR